LTDPITEDALMQLILSDEASDRLYKVAIEDRWSINRQYIGQDLWIAFGSQDELYLMPHDEMVRFAETNGWPWNAKGTRSRPRLSAAMRAHCAPYRIEPIPGEAWRAAPIPDAGHWL